MLDDVITESRPFDPVFTLYIQPWISFGVIEWIDLLDHNGTRPDRSHRDVLCTDLHMWDHCGSLRLATPTSNICLMHAGQICLSFSFRQPPVSIAQLALFKLVTSLKLR